MEPKVNYFVVETNINGGPWKAWLVTPQRHIAAQSIAITFSTSKQIGPTAYNVNGTIHNVRILEVEFSDSPTHF